MHWLGEAASRAGLKGGSTLLIPLGASTTEAWEMSARAFGISPSELANKIAPAVSLFPANFQKADQRAARLLPDDPVQRLFVTSILGKNGYRTVQASDGSAAYERIAAGEECALLVTDLQMPVMDGEALVRQLRATPRTAALPIIVITGTEDETRESQLIDLGADDYLRKPVDAPRLVARVKAALRRAGT